MSGNKYNTKLIYFDKLKITGIKGSVSELHFCKTWRFLRFKQALQRTEVEAMKSQVNVNGQLARFQSALSTVSSTPGKQGFWEDEHFTSHIFIFI